MRAQFDEIHELNEQMHAEIQLLRVDKESDRVAIEQARKNVERVKTEMGEENRAKDRAIA